jgi:hypothetical protein
MKCARRKVASSKPMRRGQSAIRGLSVKSALVLSVVACLVMGGCLVEKSREEPQVAEQTHEYAWHKNVVSTWFDISDISEAAAPRPVTCWNDVDPVQEENSYYCALPFNNMVYQGQNDELKKQMKNRWLEIKNLDNGKTAYAQWEDCGPWFVNDADYVFAGDGRARPRAEAAYDGMFDIYGNPSSSRKIQNKAGIDVSPRVRDCLALHDIGVVDWRFVDSSEVPDGPWKARISTQPPHYETRCPSVMILYRTSH